MKPLLAAARRHLLALGLALIFALTWPIDLAFAAQSRGLIDAPAVATCRCSLAMALSSPPGWRW